MRMTVFVLLPTCPGAGCQGVSQRGKTHDAAPQHTLTRCSTSQRWETVGCLLKSELWWHQAFTPVSYYLNLEPERCSWLLCLIFCFHEECCALNRCKNFFHSNWQCVIMEWDRFLQLSALGCPYVTIYGGVLFTAPSTGQESVWICP